MMTDLIKNKNKTEVRLLFDYFHHLCTQETNQVMNRHTLDHQAIEKLQVLSGVRKFPIRVKCATLPWHAMVGAMEGNNLISTEEALRTMKTHT